MSEALHAARYRLTLVRPIVVGGETLDHRDGYVVRWGGRVGDLCPLPGLSRENLEEAARALRTGAALPPSASWALASADLDGAAPQPETARLLHPFDVAPRGARVLKLKVGRGLLDEEVRWVASIAAESDAALRLDGNRGLSLDDARSLAAAAGDRLEFFEEPVGRGDLDAALAEMPIGLDESLLEGEPREGARAWVLKPTVLGAERTQALIRAAASKAVIVIISSAYESVVGRTALARLAQAVAPRTAHGLGTGEAFAGDLSMQTLDWERWR